MISWVREKVAERRAKWIRYRSNNKDEISSFDAKQPKTITPDTSNEPETAFPVPSIQPESTCQSSTTTTTFHQSTTLRLRIFTKKGKNCVIEIDRDVTGGDLKIQAVKRLYFIEMDDDDRILEQNLQLFYLILSKTRRKIDESQRLSEINLRQNEEIILTHKQTEREEPENLQGPKLEEILEATKNIEPTKSSPPMVNIENLLLQNDLQFDIRKILISLAQASAYVIGAGPYAERLIQMLKLRLLNRRKHEDDTIQCLVDMGFDRERSLYALRIKNNVYAAALEWLIDNQGTNSIEMPTTPESSHRSSFNFSCKTNNPQEQVEALLEIIRIHAHRNVPPPKEMIKSLVEMGFTEENVLQALKITRNNQAAACEWLVGGRSRVTELRDGLPTDSPVIKALLASPQVQISLGNPKMFLAYLSMLDNYSSMGMWLSDNETSGILGHILRTYHEEKHIIAINQFSSML